MEVERCVGSRGKDHRSDLPEGYYLCGHGEWVGLTKKSLSRGKEMRDSSLDMDGV